MTNKTDRKVGFVFAIIAIVVLLLIGYGKSKKPTEGKISGIICVDKHVTPKEIKEISEPFEIKSNIHIMYYKITDLGGDSVEIHLIYDSLEMDNFDSTYTKGIIHFIDYDIK